MTGPATAGRQLRQRVFRRRRIMGGPPRLLQPVELRPGRHPGSVSLWHGMRDFLPVAHARWLADRIPNVTTHFPADHDDTNVEETNQAAAFAWLTAHT